ncbi:hypothetical protein [Qipengyuania sp. JC766]|uniref:hypothetical protein n=1 Tax=Qipengyuania sp. JC766 TaxID=3232139 RepID=UPI003459F7C9
MKYLFLAALPAALALSACGDTNTETDMSSDVTSANNPNNPDTSADAADGQSLEEGNMVAPETPVPDVAATPEGDAEMTEETMDPATAE